MKRSKIIEIIIDNICHDPSAYNPKWRWNAFSKNIKVNIEEFSQFSNTGKKKTIFL